MGDHAPPPQQGTPSNRSPTTGCGLHVVGGSGGSVVTFDADRKAARILLVDPDDRLLLFCMHDPDRPARGEWWITPGGGVEADESFEDAGRRELFEETGIVADVLGPMIEESMATWMWGERLVRQHHRFYVVATSSTAVVSDGWEESEHLTTRSHRWWTLPEIVTTRERILPENLATLGAEAVRLAQALR